MSSNQTLYRFLTLDPVLRHPEADQVRHEPWHRAARHHHVQLMEGKPFESIFLCIAQELTHQDKEGEEDHKDALANEK